MLGGCGDIALVHRVVAVNVEGKFGEPFFSRHRGILEEGMSGERSSDEKREFVQSYSLKEVMDFVDVFGSFHDSKAEKGGRLGDRRGGLRPIYRQTRKRNAKCARRAWWVVSYSGIWSVCRTLFKDEILEIADSPTPA
jgi:hypothetical protein